MSDFNECSDQEPCSGPELLGKLLEHLGLGEQNGNGAETYMIIHSGCKGLNPSNNVNYNFLRMLYQKTKSKNFPQEQFIILLLPKNHHPSFNLHCGYRGRLWSLAPDLFWVGQSYVKEPFTRTKVIRVCQGWCTERPRGMGWRGRWEGESGWGTHVNPWLIHVNVWQKPL